MTFVEAQRKPITINGYVRALNAFLRWASEEGHIAELIRLDFLKQEERLIETLSEQQVNRLLAWKPGTFAEKRLQVLCAVAPWAETNS